MMKNIYFVDKIKFYRHCFFFEISLKNIYREHMLKYDKKCSEGQSENVEAEYLFSHTCLAKKKFRISTISISLKFLFNPSRINVLFRLEIILSICIFNIAKEDSHLDSTLIS